MQTAANICLSLAALIYLIPLQHLRWELARKKDDGGGAIAGGIVLGSMWTLLLVGLILATARGAFDWLLLSRTLLYPLVVAATVALLGVTFLGLASLNRASWSTRLLLGWPVYVMPVLTIALVALTLNPTLGTGVPPAAVRLPWTVLAGLSLVCCMGILGYKYIVTMGRRLASIPRLLAREGELERRNLAVVATLHPARDFERLLGYANTFQPAKVRELAIVRARGHPQFLETMMRALREGDAARSLAFLESAALTAEERQQFAAPALDAALRLAGRTRGDLQHAPESRRKAARSRGRQMFSILADTFAGTGVDFTPARAAFEDAFAPEALGEHASFPRPT